MWWEIRSLCTAAQLSCPLHVTCNGIPCYAQVRALFTVAACVPPAVIFIDEIDSILSARKAEGASSPPHVASPQTVHQPVH